MGGIIIGKLKYAPLEGLATKLTGVIFRLQILSAIVLYFQCHSEFISESKKLICILYHFQLVVITFQIVNLITWVSTNFESNSVQVHMSLGIKNTPVNFVATPQEGNFVVQANFYKDNLVIDIK